MNNAEKQLIYSTLVQIKPIGYYKGFRLLITIIETIIDRDKYDYNLSKDIYPIVAGVHRCNPRSIERNLRTLLLNIDTARLFALTASTPVASPTVKMLIDILVTYIRMGIVNYETDIMTP